jgi:hypothetical protein
LDKNSTESITVTRLFRLDRTGGDIIYVNNAEVYCNINSKNVTMNITRNSEIKNYSDCKNGEVAYIKITAKINDINQSGSITFDDCSVSSFLDF